MIAKRDVRRRRVDGEVSRRRILDAATEIAAERGYEGTSIGAVSAKCGLPASSIYWHFANKDDLIAAVIERSFTAWLAGWELPDSADRAGRERLIALAVHTAKALSDSPDFLRLGLMLALERRPVEPRAREVFLRMRERAISVLGTAFSAIVDGLTEDQARVLATYAIAGADGMFIAKEVGGDSVDLLGLFAMHGGAIYDAAVRMTRDSLEFGGAESQ